MRIKRTVALLLAVLTIIMLASCKKKAEPADETTSEVTTEKETTAETTNNEPQFTNPLTGLESDKDLSKQRPVSIMVNNISVSLPQEGIAQADIMYECLAEGGITRLMMISTDYEKLTKIGSVRSARDYYIDFAESYNCIFIHAGASQYAANTLAARGTNHIDGLIGTYTSATKTFFRDPERLKVYASEHTLMIQNGAGIKAAIDYSQFPAEKAAGYEKPMNFAKWGTEVKADKTANHVFVDMSGVQKVDFVYDRANQVYKRYQYNGDKHIDNTTGEQLTFKNVILMFNDAGAISGDEKNRIWMQTTGQGNGWYITDGTYKEITWKKEQHDSVIKYFYSDGTEVQLNRGKTMINVVPLSNQSLVVFDNETSSFN